MIRSKLPHVGTTIFTVMTNRARELNALAAFLKSPDAAGRSDPQAAIPERYTIDGYPLFLDPHGVPAITPPSS